MKTNTRRKTNAELKLDDMIHADDARDIMSANLQVVCVSLIVVMLQGINNTVTTID